MYRSRTWWFSATGGLHGYASRDLHEASFTATEMKEGQWTATDLNGVYSAKELHGSYDAGELKTGGFTAHDLKEGDYAARDLHDANFSAQEMKDGQWTAGELHNVFAAGEMRNVYEPYDRSEERRVGKECA